VYGSGPAKRRYTVGSADRLTLAQARDKAREILAHAELGADPQAERVAERQKADAGTLDELADRFMLAKPRKRGGKWRPATEAIYRHAFDSYILPRFGHSDPSKITRHELRVFLDGIATRTPTMANRVLETFRRCYSWALSRDYVASTPFVGIEKPAQERKATRTFSNDEVRRIFAAVVGTELRDVVPLIFHTATRSEETRAMRWSHLDFERALWTIPPELAKTGEIKQEAHTVPLSKGALAILRRIRERQKTTPVRDLGSAHFVFPAATGPCETCGHPGHMDKPNKATALLKAALSMEGERGFLHHIRRTVSDRLRQDLAVAPYVVEAVLGHLQQGLSKIYMPSDPAILMREALDRWCAHLASILAPKKERRHTP